MKNSDISMIGELLSPGRTAPIQARLFASFRRDMRLMTMSANVPELLLLRETWSHMAAVSGFDPLFMEIERKTGTRSFHVSDGGSQNFLARKISRVSLRREMRKNAKAGGTPTKFATRVHEDAGSRLLKAARTSDAKIILSVGENQYGKILSNAGPEIRRRMFLCFHQPPSWMRVHWSDFASLDGLGGIFCLSRSHQRYFQSICGSPVFHLHHGAMIDFFTPLPTPETTPKLLFVGKWLRDIDTLRRAMPIIWKSRPDVELDCVIPMSGRDYPALIDLARDERVRWHSDLTAEQLRSLYQQSTLLFLPLADAVANNAIVEALACGLPVVTTDIGGSPEYVLTDETGALCEPGSATGHAESVLRWIADPEKRAAAAIKARHFAEQNLGWKPIADEMLTRIRQPR